MRLKKIDIKNYRSCKDVGIEVGGMHALVGANNAGKSNVLRALDFLFNPSVSKVGAETFWDCDTSLTIWIEALFDDLSESEKEALQGYLGSDGTFRMARSAKIGAPSNDEDDVLSTDESKVSISQHYCVSMPKLDWLCSSKINGKAIEEWWQQKEDLSVNGVSFADFVGDIKPNVTAWREKADEYAQQHLTEADYEESWADNPRGYAGVLKGILPHFILVPAVRELSDETRVTKTNPLGRLLYAVIENVTDAQQGVMDASLKEMRKMLNKAGGEARLSTITETEGRLNKILKEYMDCALELEFQTPTLEVLLTTPKIFVDDGFRNVAENKGHGLQRAIIFSIIRCYSELVTGVGDKKKRTMILAVEEPELCMHPQAQRTIRRVFTDISQGGDQVVFSTHSSLLLDVADFDQIVRLEAVKEVVDASNTVRTLVWQLPMLAMIQDFRARHSGTTATEESLREQYANAYHPARAEGFFARKVILVEGATEQYALPIYAEAAGYLLDNLNISIVDCGGKGPMDRLYRVFNELGIPCYMLFDYDKDSGEANTVDKSRELLGLIGLSPNPPGAVLAEAHGACFPSKWETDLAAEIPDLGELTSQARSALGQGSGSGKPLVARHVAKALTSRNPPEIPPSIRRIIEKAVNVEWTASCLAVPLSA